MGILGDMMFGCPLLDVEPKGTICTYNVPIPYVPRALYLSVSPNTVEKRHHCNDLMSKLSMVGFL